jgi:heme/copper-type cytochrome/quinol oxidase subunit 2
MKNKKLVIGIFLGVVLLIAALVAFLYQGSVPTSQQPVAAEPPPPTPVETHTETPTNILVPGEKEINVPADVAVPSLVAPTMGKIDAHYRVFEFRAEGGKFTPNTINVNRRDILRFVVTAVDADYAFTQPDYGLDIPIPKGTTRTIEFGSADPGSFLFYCGVCGGPEKGPTGWLNVTNPE